MGKTTKDALGESLKRLLLHTTLDKITVKDIVEECGVNRQTFYYHFQDIFDLLSWVFIQEANKTLQENRTCNTWKVGFLQTLCYIKEHKKLVLNVYRSVSRETLERYLYYATYGLLKHVIEEEAEGMCVAEKDKKFIADFYKYAFVGLVLEWIRLGLKEEPEEIVIQLGTLIEGNLKKDLQKFNQKRPVIQRKDLV
ncbi:TetR/AcrR family transcriptional regulator [Velocimicrobium porci]|uniref:TetR family transcriptional regulator n=1 Tax=Velocimicrobium porci TaxID=2606634 RepID=A0A6L5XWZ6_9FIRM|nr:TetR/AcrR family transcriptional regulator [Velocimicrobium porci]MSS63139.1 TetR family transcriptional regulator [Velocimicrobium porci]